MQWRGLVTSALTQKATYGGNDTFKNVINGLSALKKSFMTAAFTKNNNPHFTYSDLVIQFHLHQFQIQITVTFLFPYTAPPGKGWKISGFYCMS